MEKEETYEEMKNKRKLENCLYGVALGLFEPLYISFDYLKPDKVEKWKKILKKLNKHMFCLDESTVNRTILKVLSHFYH